MPKGEPRFKYREDGYGALPGLQYARAILAGENIRLKIIRRPSDCDHGITLCHAIVCIDSWQIDHTILFEATAGGRELIERANEDGTEHDKRKNPKHSAHPLRIAS